MADPLTRGQILEATERVIRRYGPRKATVVDVARELGVVHGSVYRHFSSKADLRDAVAEVWLSRISAPLAGIAEDRTLTPPERLRAWLDALVAAKRRKVGDDPELFAAYASIAAASRDVVAAHVDALVRQIEDILRDGAREGVFRLEDPRRAAHAVFQATSRFHDPVHAESWTSNDIESAWRAVRDLVIAGLGAP